MQSIDHCEGNVLQLISLRQLIIVQLDMEYYMQLFYNFYLRRRNRRGTVFGRVCLSVCLSVFLSVRKISQEW